jgi:hypothetical protein
MAAATIAPCVDERGRARRRARRRGGWQRRRPLRDAADVAAVIAHVATEPRAGSLPREVENAGADHHASARRGDK